MGCSSSAHTGPRGLLKVVRIGSNSVFKSRQALFKTNEYLFVWGPRRPQQEQEGFFSFTQARFSADLGASCQLKCAKCLHHFVHPASGFDSSIQMCIFFSVTLCFAQKMHPRDHQVCDLFIYVRFCTDVKHQQNEN